MGTTTDRVADINGAGLPIIAQGSAGCVLNSSWLDASVGSAGHTIIHGKRRASNTTKVFVAGLRPVADFGIVTGCIVRRVRKTVVCLITHVDSAFEIVATVGRGTSDTTKRRITGLHAVAVLAIVTRLIIQTTTTTRRRLLLFPGAELVCGQATVLCFDSSGTTRVVVHLVGETNTVSTQRFDLMTLTRIHIITDRRHREGGRTPRCFITAHGGFAAQ